MSSDKSRKTFLVATAAVLAAAAALPQLLARGKTRVDAGALGPAAKLKRDSRAVSREDSRFA